MITPEILIPFALPPAEHANDLLKRLTSECGKEGLAMLLARNHSLVHTTFENFLPSLPHETCFTTWLNQQQSSFLQYQASLCGVDLNPGYWFLINPVHLHIARNHLVLMDHRQLALSEQDALSLFEKAKMLCDEAGLELVWGAATVWFLRANDWSDFITASPDAACGHNIDLWLATGSKQLAWRKLQNEIQMEWFLHPLQQQREQRGEKTINGLWLWSGAELPSGFVAHSSAQINSMIAMPNAEFGQFLSSAPSFVLLDQLSSAALSNDWETWVTCMIKLEHSWFKPLCAALKNSKQINRCQLYLSNSHTLLTLQTSGSALRKFWRMPTFKPLIT